MPHTRTFSSRCVWKCSLHTHTHTLEIILQLSFSYGNFTRSFAFPSPQSGQTIEAHIHAPAELGVAATDVRFVGRLIRGPVPVLVQTTRATEQFWRPIFTPTIRFSVFPLSPPKTSYFLTPSPNQQHQRKIHNGPIVQCLITFVRRYSLWYDMPV